MLKNEPLPLIKVLLADDDLLMHDLVCHALDEALFEVDAVTNGQMAIERCLEIKPDIVLLDVNMPGMDGFTVCEKIRQFDLNSNISIVMITGLDDISSIKKAYYCGADDFISKPIAWPTLEHRLTYLHRGNMAMLEVQANIRSEKALYDAIPDSIIIFDADYQLKNFHQGEQQYLFNDHTGSEENQGAVITMLMEFYKVASTKKISGNLLNDFINQVAIEGKNYHLECRKAQLDDNEIIIVVRDISQRKKDEERILNLVMYDPLTGLPNRKYLEEQLTRDIANCTRTNDSLALLFINIRAFSVINDTYGLSVGDELIIAIGERVAGLLRTYDMTARHNSCKDSELSRFSGDEFAIIIRDLSSINDIDIIVRRIHCAMEVPFEIAGAQIVVDIYIGCSLCPDNAQDATTLITTADSAMHLNKQNPTLSMSYYDIAINDSAKRRHLLENRLRTALKEKEFSLVIQPKISLSNSEFLSGELLIRWHNDELGNVSPAEFIPIAEQSGMIIEISKWVFEEGCRVATKFAEEAGLTVNLAVNISPQIFLAKEDFPAYFLRVLNHHELPASQFELEVTEYVLMNNADETINTFNRLQKMGFNIALDDFGTGYSSLSYLTQFNLDTLKIDRLFVSTLDSERSKKLVKSMIALAQQLDMNVVAEGVELAEELAFLKELKCDYVQGFYLAKPMSPNAYVEFVHQQRAHSYQ